MHSWEGRWWQARHLPPPRIFGKMEIGKEGNILNIKTKNSKKKNSKYILLS
jgi:hypothetical protein